MILCHSSPNNDNHHLFSCLSFNTTRLWTWDKKYNFSLSVSGIFTFLEQSMGHRKSWMSELNGQTCAHTQEFQECGPWESPGPSDILERQPLPWLCLGEPHKFWSSWPLLSSLPLHWAWNWAPRVCFRQTCGLEKSPPCKDCVIITFPLRASSLLHLMWGLKEITKRTDLLGKDSLEQGVIFWSKLPIA